MAKQVNIAEEDACGCGGKCACGQAEKKKGKKIAVLEEQERKCACGHCNC